MPTDCTHPVPDPGRASVCTRCDAVVAGAPVPVGKVVPSVGAAAVAGRVRAWLDGLTAVPVGFARRAEVGTFELVEHPYWLWEMEAVFSYRGEHGRRQSTADSEDDTDGAYQWTTEEGQRLERITDWVGAGSGRVMGPFFGPLAPWTGGPITGRDAVATWEEARRTLEREIRWRVESAIGGDRQRIETLDTTLLAATARLVIVPSWVGSYRFAGETHPLTVSADTGTVWGHSPFGGPKRWALFAGTTATLAVMAVGCASWLDVPQWITMAVAAVLAWMLLRGT